jgi:hypothetical protein
VRANTSLLERSTLRQNVSDILFIPAAGGLEYKGVGKQFTTTPLKRGHNTKDIYFDKEFNRIFEAYINL